MKDWAKAKPNKFATGTRPVSIRMNTELVQWLMEESQRRGMRGYQTLANEILNNAMKNDSDLIEVKVRDIVRDELRKAK